MSYREHITVSFVISKHGNCPCCWQDLGDKPLHITGGFVDLFMRKRHPAKDNKKKQKKMGQTESTKPDGRNKFKHTELNSTVKRQ